MTDRIDGNLNNEDIKPMMIANSSELENMSTEQIVRLSAINIMKMDGKISDMGVQLASLEQRTATVERDQAEMKREQELNAKIEPWQDKIIKKKITHKVKDILGEDYWVHSKRSIAYGWCYDKVSGFGYVSKCQTKRRYYDIIISAIDNGAIDFTKYAVNDRYKYLQTKK